MKKTPEKFYINEFRDADLVKKMVQKIESKKCPQITIMEVCGTHTMSICRYGLRDVLPSGIDLISGPGCPVCVTPVEYIDTAIEYSRKEAFTVATFGDLVRVPGSNSSLENEKARGSSIITVYSPLEALSYAKNNPEKQVVFLAVGFETTIAVEAVVLDQAVNENINNFSFLSSQKVIPPAMEALVQDKEVNVNGFLCPGHVSVIIGSKAYRLLARDYHIPCVIAGFEPVDILYGISLLIDQIVTHRAEVEIAYTRMVTEDGNTKAQELINKYFHTVDPLWRGLGRIPRSGLKLKDRYASFDAEKRFPVKISSQEEPKGCLCGDILRGTKKPAQCPLFGNKCTPASPVGACMVSSEGTCAAWYKYRRQRTENK